jgi:hypothetical protein
MSTILHILTREHDSLAAEIIALENEKSVPDCRTVTVDLTRPAPDYSQLLDAIFAADSVVVW